MAIGGKRIIAGNVDRIGAYSAAGQGRTRECGGNAILGVGKIEKR